MKDTVAFIFFSVSLFYYICKYRLLYFEGALNRTVKAEGFLLALALVTFAIATLFYQEEATALPSLVVVVVGLLFDALENEYPGRGLVASTAAVSYLFVDGIKEHHPPLIGLTSAFLVGVVLLHGTGRLFPQADLSYRAISLQQGEF